MNVTRGWLPLCPTALSLSLSVSLSCPCTHPLIVALCLSVRFVALFISKHIPAACCGFTSGLLLLSPLLLLLLLLLHLYHSQTKSPANPPKLCGETIVLIVDGLPSKFCQHSLLWLWTGSKSSALVQKSCRRIYVSVRAKHTPQNRFYQLRKEFSLQFIKLSRENLSEPVQYINICFNLSRENLSEPIQCINTCFNLNILKRESTWNSKFNEKT